MISSGVRRSSSMGRAKITQITDNSTDRIAESQMEAPNAFRTLRSSREPKNCATTTENPSVSELMAPLANQTRDPVDATAVYANVSSVLPTMTISATL